MQEPVNETYLRIDHLIVLFLSSFELGYDWSTLRITSLSMIIFI